MLPRAPEPTIMSIGLNTSEENWAAIASLTSSVASVQISVSFWRRSPSVMMPRRNCVLTFAASAPRRSRISAFAAGVFTSSIEIVRPDRAANEKHRFLTLSSTLATMPLG